MPEALMTTPNFEAICQPTNAQIASIELLNPHSPFNTAAYAAALVELGKMPCYFALTKSSNVESGCLGFLEAGALSSQLEIVSAPRLSSPAVFWNGVFEFCREQSVWDLKIETYASETIEIPALPGEIARRNRCEFVIDLDQIDLQANFTKGHRYDIRRAQKAGLAIQRTRDPSAIQEHLRLIDASMDRRKARGEIIDDAGTSRFFEALLKSGSAEVFQATDGETVCSSMIVARATHSGYYQSAGTDPDGMRRGASKYMIAEVARILKEEGGMQFNLGGAGEVETGLREFKTGFGARAVPLESASFSLASPMQKKIRAAARLMRNSSRDFLTGIGSRVK